MFANVRSCFSWDLFYYLNYECGVINEYIISLYVWVEVYVDFLYLMSMVWLHIGLLCDVVFSRSFLFFPWTALNTYF
jgi:hypothetical protein